MSLDPSESINNMGDLRVDVLDASDLPSADRNGYSDPYCKFDLNGKDVFKTKVQKKTLHPEWNEFFEVPITSRTAAKFVCTVYDWDFGEKADFLGAAEIPLDLLTPFSAEVIKLRLDGKSGEVRLRLLFKPSLCHSLATRVIDILWHLRGSWKDRHWCCWSSNQRCWFCCPWRRKRCLIHQARL